VYAILGKYNQFEEDYWDRLRQGFNLNDAVNESLPPAGRTKILGGFRCLRCRQLAACRGLSTCEDQSCAHKKSPGSSGCLNGAKATAPGKIL